MPRHERTCLQGWFKHLYSNIEHGHIEIQHIAMVFDRIQEEPYSLYESVFGVPTRLGTNRTLQLQKVVRGLEFGIEVEELYNLCSENKGTDS